MQKMLSEFSGIIIPAIVFYIIGYGVVSQIPVYEKFVMGVENGFKTVLQIAPTLVGLLIAVNVLRSSGFLDFLATVLQKPAQLIGIPKEVVPLAVIKLFSGSAATGMVIDLFKTFGPDSYIGRVVSIMMSSTETVFYTMSVYFFAAHVTKTRYTLLGSLMATCAGILASVLLAG